MVGLIVTKRGVENPYCRSNSSILSLLFTPAIVEKLSRKRFNVLCLTFPEESRPGGKWSTEIPVSPLYLPKIPSRLLPNDFLTMSAEPSSESRQGVRQPVAPAMLSRRRIPAKQFLNRGTSPTDSDVAVCYSGGESNSAGWSVP